MTTDAVNPLLDRLHRWEQALDNSHELEKLRDGELRKTPTAEQFDEQPRYSWPLLAAVALVDAAHLRCPGTDDGMAQQLCERVFAEQVNTGLLNLSAIQEEQEAQPHEWDAAMAAILYVAREKNLPGLADTAAMWWRQVLDEHRDEAPFTEPRTAIAHFINRGHRVQKSKVLAQPDLVSVRLFYRMENVPLPKPINPWPSAGKE